MSVVRRGQRAGHPGVAMAGTWMDLAVSGAFRSIHRGRYAARHRGFAPLRLRDRS